MIERDDRLFGSKAFYLLLTIMLVGAVAFLFAILIGVVTIGRDERARTCDVVKTYIDGTLEPYQNRQGGLYRHLGAQQRARLVRLETLRDGLPC